MMKTAFSTLFCTEFTVNEIISLARKVGIDGIELRVDDAMLENLLADENEQKLLMESGIAVCDVASSIFVRGDGEIPVWRDYVKLAYKLGSPAVRVFAASNYEGVLDLNAISDDLRRLCDIADEYGIEIWLENHSELSRGETCGLMLDKVKRKNLRILWDVLHSIEYGESLSETLSYISDYVVHVHTKDGYYVSGQTEYKLCALGEGSFPFDELVKALKKIGFDGYLSLEWESKWHPYLGDIYTDNCELLEAYKRILKKTEALE